MKSASAATGRSMVRAVVRGLPMKPLLFRGLRRLVRLPERVYRHLHFQGPMQVAIDRRHRFEIMHWGNQIENDLFWAGFAGNWEATSLRLWVRLAAQADAVYDVGANTGVFALAAKAVNPGAAVFAFEPVERVHARLLKNIERNGFDVSAIRAGLSNRSGTASFYDTAADHVYSASLDASMLQGRADVVETRIEVLRFDDFLARHPVSGAILAKIDTERHELQVLEGFGAVLAQRRPTLLVEVLDRVQGAGLEQLLHGLDYACFEIREGSGVYPAEHLGAAERNYLLCPRQVACALGIEAGISHAALAGGNGAGP